MNRWSIRLTVALHPAAMTALVPAALVAFFALAGAAGTLPQFFDPCHDWGTGTGQNEVALDEDCPSRSGTSQTRGEAMLNLVAIQGVLLVAAACIAIGAFRLDRAWTGIGATLVAVMVPPFGLGIFWLPVLLLGTLVFGAAASYPVTALERPARRLLPYAVGVVGTALVASFLVVAGAMMLAGLVIGMGAAGGVGTAWIDRRATGSRSDSE